VHVPARYRGAWLARPHDPTHGGQGCGGYCQITVKAKSGDPDLEDYCIADCQALYDGLHHLERGDELGLAVIGGEKVDGRHLKAEPEHGEIYDASTFDAEFNESDHPRAPDGKFGSGGGSSGGSVAKTPFVNPAGPARPLGTYPQFNPVAFGVQPGQTTQQQLDARKTHLALVDQIQKGQGDAAANALKILAGATPALTYTPSLGVDGSHAGSFQLSNGSASAHTRKAGNSGQRARMAAAHCSAV
jgi:hypothetical protein